MPNATATYLGGESGRQVTEPSGSAHAQSSVPNLGTVVRIKAGGKELRHARLLSLYLSLFFF